jgi:lipopolysaccharide/colanic/teichoic acid biosynthesis glycosyltransferase
MTPILKRAFDILISAFLFIGLFPLMVVAGVVVWGGMGRPILFRQIRPGLDAKPFQLIKFRTMSEAFDRSGHPLPDEHRLTRIGKFLRRTSLDELPQLINVLKGDMSLVGPRPLLMEYLPLYSPRQARRHDVRPGITGWAQVKGRNALSWEERLELDAWYVEHASLALDLKILLLTVRQAISGRGVTAEGHATMPKFTGSGTGPRNGG